MLPVAEISQVQQEDSGVWSIFKGKGKREAQSLTDTYPILLAFEMLGVCLVSCLGIFQFPRTWECAWREKAGSLPVEIT